MKSSLVIVTVLVGCFLPAIRAQVEGVFCSESSTVFMPSPDAGECSVNFRCSKNVWVKYRCATGLVFNPDTQLCVFPEDNPACSNPSPANFASLLRAVDQSSDCAMPCSPQLDAVYPKLSETTIDCNGFYACRAGRLYEGLCTDLGDGFAVYDTFSRSCSKEVDQFNFNCATYVPPSP
ncbi:uncharacterized protein LOC124133459 [Haliotis rufescens]|uniref:uncharacterized protein LOC124133459 n=1 Tax=Haliotis rufescens TaxID=6454 RepID=UPI001EAFAFBD|nr:uncharacterized protein LOC124133459 [Haliotis rufescens]